MRSTTATRLRVLPLLAALATTPALAEPVSADIAQLLQGMQERLSKVEARNAELEQRLLEATPTSDKEAALSVRVDDLENEVVALQKRPDPMERFESVSVGASLTMVAQHAKSGGVDESQVTARADVEVELPGGSIGNAEGRIFGHFRAGDGDGLMNNAFATSNATAFGNNPQPVLMQAWYQLDVPVGGDSGSLGQVEITAGKIDPFGFFDGNNLSDDESEGFLNLAFVHNPLLDAGGDIGVGTHGASPGMRLAYVSDINGGNHVTASLGMFGAGPGADYSDSFAKPFTIAQLEYAGKNWNGLEGTYRINVWNNARAYDQVTMVTDTDGDTIPDQGAEERHAGWGISVDQQVSAHAGLFARYGHSTKGVMAFDRGFTLGGQLSGTLWGRDADRLGMAFGTLRASSEYEAAGSGSGSERIYELFYAWQPNDTLQFTPSVQYIDNAAGTGADVTVWGLRAKASY